MDASASLDQEDKITRGIKEIILSSSAAQITSQWEDERARRLLVKRVEENKKR